MRDAAMDLNLVDTADLLRVLSQRFDGLVFAGVQHQTSEDDEITTLYSGSFTACSGLCEVVATDMTSGLQATHEGNE